MAVDEVLYTRSFPTKERAEEYAVGWRRRGYDVVILPAVHSRNWELKIHESDASKEQRRQDSRNTRPEVPAQINSNIENRILMALHILPDGIGPDQVRGWSVTEHPVLGIAEFRSPRGHRYRLGATQFVERFVNTGFFAYSTLLGSSSPSAYDGGVPAVPLRPFLANEMLDFVLGTGTDYTTPVIPEEIGHLEKTLVYFMEYVSGNRSQCLVVTSTSSRVVQTHVSRLSRREQTEERAPQRRPHIVIAPTPIDATPGLPEQEEPKVEMPVVKEFGRKVEL